MEGMGWFGYESMKRITQRHPEHEFIFIFDRPFDPAFVFAKNVTPLVLFPPTRHPLLWITWFEVMLPLVLRKHKPDLFLSPDGMISLLSRTKSVAVIHDLNFIYYRKDMPRMVEKYYNFFFPRFARKAARIATVSEYSKRDIIKNYGIVADKIDVVYNGANLMYEPIPEEKKREIKKELTGGENYFLFVGAMHPRKNIVNLFKAFDVFKNKEKSLTKLVVVGNKMYCVVLLDESHAVSFKTTPEDFAELTEREGIIPAPYSARYHWVLVSNPLALTAKEWKHFVEKSYELVFDKLPRKVKTAI